MSPEISERAFEDAIECGLLEYGPDACAGNATAFREISAPFGETPPGGYRKRRPEDYDRTLCLLSRDVVDFVLATQPKEWKKLEQHHGAAVKEQFLRRLAAEIERRGALDILRNGIKDSGCKFRLAYFRPASGLNEETQRLHAANLFAVVRQVHYSTKNDQPSPGLRPAGKSLDLPSMRAWPTLRWDLKQGRLDDKVVTHAVLKTIAAFLNTEGGDLLIGVADDGVLVGTERDQLETDDKFMRHLAQVVRSGLGDRAGTCIDPKTQILQGKTVCVVSCQRSPEPVFLKWKGLEANPAGDFFVRSGPGTVKLPIDSAKEYVRTRFPSVGGEIPSSDVGRL